MNASGLQLLGGLLILVAAVSLSRSLFSADAARTHLLVGTRLAAEDGPLQRLPARLKLLGALLLALVAATAPLTRVYPLLLIPAGLAAAARLPARLVVGRLAELLPFVLLAASGALLAGDAERFALVLCRALVTLLAMVVVLVTTPLPDLLRAAGRLGLPPPIGSIVALGLRYLLVLIDEAHRMGTGFECRAVGPRNRHYARALGRLVGALGIRTIERGERIHQAMLARGYHGELPSLAVPERLTARQVLGFAAFAMVVALVGWLP